MKDKNIEGKIIENNIKKGKKNIAGMCVLNFAKFRKVKKAIIELGIA